MSIFLTLYGNDIVVESFVKAMKPFNPTASDGEYTDQDIDSSGTSA